MRGYSVKLDQSMASMGKCTFESNHFHSLVKEQNHDYLFYCPRQKQNTGLVTKKKHHDLSIPAGRSRPHFPAGKKGPVAVATAE